MGAQACRSDEPSRKGRRREAHSPGGPGPESRRDFSNLSGGLQSDAKEHQTYPVVTLANAEQPRAQNRRPPRNGHRPEWAASDAGLGDNALNSSPCSVAQTRGRVAASAMRPEAAWLPSTPATACPTSPAQAAIRRRTTRPRPSYCRRTPQARTRRRSGTARIRVVRLCKCLRRHPRRCPT